MGTVSVVTIRNDAPFQRPFVVSPTRYWPKSRKPQTLVQIQDGKLVSVYSGGKTLGPARYPTPAWSKRK